jgi:hypothetical protein
MDQVGKVTQGMADFAVWLYIPTVKAEPCGGGQSAVEDGKQGGFLLLGGPLAGEEPPNQWPVRLLDGSVGPEGEAVLEACFLNALETAANIMFEEGR